MSYQPSDLNDRTARMGALEVRHRITAANMTHFVRSLTWQAAILTFGRGTRLPREWSSSTLHRKDLDLDGEEHYVAHLVGHVANAPWSGVPSRILRRMMKLCVGVPRGPHMVGRLRFPSGFFSFFSFTFIY